MIGHYSIGNPHRLTYEINHSQHIEIGRRIAVDIDSTEVSKGEFKVDSLYFLSPPHLYDEIDSSLVDESLEYDVLLGSHSYYLYKEYPYYWCWNVRHTRKQYYVRNDSTIERVVIDNPQQDSSHSIYALFPMGTHGPFISDMFCLKLDKTKPDYYMGEYLVLPEIGNYAFQLREKDTAMYGANFPVFNYKIRKGNHYTPDKILPEVFLYLNFCPQIGILSYHYVKQNIYINLTHIDNIPLKEYINTKGCITPFCDIK